MCKSDLNFDASSCTGSVTRMIASAYLWDGRSCYVVCRYDWHKVEVQFNYNIRVQPR